VRTDAPALHALLPQIRLSPISFFCFLSHFEGCPPKKPTPPTGNRTKAPFHAMSKPTTVKGSPPKPFGLNHNAQAIPTQATLGKNFLGLGPNLTALGLATVFFGVYYGTAWYTRKWVHEQTDGNPVRPHSFSEVKVVDNSEKVN